MRIEALEADNYRGFGKLRFEPASHVTLCVARNGVGKTTLIDAVGVGLAALARDSLGGLVHERDHRRRWVEDPALPVVAERNLSVRILARWADMHLVSEARSFRKADGSIDSRIAWVEGKDLFQDRLHEVAATPDALPLLAWLPATRLPPGPRPDLPAPDPLSARQRLAVFTRGPVIDLDWWALRNRWYQLEAQPNSRRADNGLSTARNAVQRAIGSSTPPRWNGDAEDLVVFVPDEGPRPVGLMSDGWRTWVGTVVALALRCAELNPAHADAAAETPGVLAIDELEQHLHPALQLEILNGMRRAFPQLQVIATTHSPLVLTDIRDHDADLILALDRRDNGAVEFLRRPATIGRNALEVLTGGWFELQSTLDDDTLQLLARHRQLLRQAPAEDDERRDIAIELRKRLGRFAETSVEEMVLSVVAELEQLPAFRDLAAGDIRSLRAEVLRRIREALP